jgi:hypothetical protein
MFVFRFVDLEASARLQFIQLVMRRLNANRCVGEWVEAIWNHAREVGLVEDVPLDKASIEDMERIWSKVFRSRKVKTIVLTEYIHPEKLLDWWKATQKQSDWVAETARKSREPAPE